MTTRIATIAAGLVLLACSLSAADKVQMPDMSGPTTCVAVYELNAAGAEVFVGMSQSPSFKGDHADLGRLMDAHVKHSLQFVGRMHGKSEKWLANAMAAPVLFTPGPAPDGYAPHAVGPGGDTVCWCATPTRDPATKAITGCEFPCGACEHCVVKG